MNLYIGGMSKTNLDVIDYVDKEKIYGVQFINNNNTTNVHTFGKRLYTSAQYRFYPDVNSNPGIDDFIEREAGPFMIRECCTTYNSETGKQEVVCYKGDSNWSTESAKSTNNIMIEFPKFYFYLSDYQMAVSSEPVKGFSPSQMHYRNGKLYDYVYISKYCVNSDLVSRSVSSEDAMSIVPTTRSYNQHISSAYSDTVDESYNGRRSIVSPQTRFDLKNNGLRCLDYKVYFSIAMLMAIKYNTFNLYNVFGPVANADLPIQFSSLDGIQKNYNGDITHSTLGLINFFYNRKDYSALIINGITIYPQDLGRSYLGGYIAYEIPIDRSYAPRLYINDNYVNSNLIEDNINSYNIINKDPNNTNLIHPYNIDLNYKIFQDEEGSNEFINNAVIVSLANRSETFNNAKRNNCIYLLPYSRSARGSNTKHCITTAVCKAVSNPSFLTINNDLINGTEYGPLNFTYGCFHNDNVVSYPARMRTYFCADEVN